MKSRPLSPKRRPRPSPLFQQHRDALVGTALQDETSIAASLGRNAPMIFDRLGLGILISRDDVPIYANRYLLDFLGYADEDALHAAGGMARIFEQVRHRR